MYTSYYNITTLSLTQGHGGRHVRGCSARYLWRVSGRSTAHLKLRSRPWRDIRCPDRVAQERPVGPWRSRRHQAIGQVARRAVAVDNGCQTAQDPAM